MTHEGVHRLADTVDVSMTTAKYACEFAVLIVAFHHEACAHGEASAFSALLVVVFRWRAYGEDPVVLQISRYVQTAGWTSTVTRDVKI